MNKKQGKRKLHLIGPNATGVSVIFSNELVYLYVEPRIGTVHQCKLLDALIVFHYCYLHQVSVNCT